MTSDGDGSSRPGDSHDRFGIVLAAIVLAGLIGRVAYVIWMRHDPVGVDGFEYRLRAAAVAGGHGYVNPLQAALAHARPVPDALDPPAWIIVLVGAIKLGLRSTLSQQLVACAIGSTTIAMTGLAGRAAFGRRAGLIAAGIVALYPNTWLYERELMSEPLALLGVATCIWLAYRFSAKPSSRLVFVLGIAVGVLAMTRSEQILVLPFMVLPLVLTARATVRRRIMWLALAGFACALVITPWFAYNQTRFARPVPLSTAFGPALKQGNCDATYSGKLLGYYQLGFGYGCGVGIAHLSTDQSIADGQYRRAALEYMRAHASRVPIVVAARIGRTFNLFRPFQQVHLEAERTTKIWVLQGALFCYWLLLPFAVFGCIIARRRRTPIFPLLAFPVIVVVSVAFTIGAVRYRAPAEISLALLVAFALDTLANRGPRSVPQRDA